MLAVCRKNVMEALTGEGDSVNFGFPKKSRGVAIAVSQSPTVKKVLPAYSANFRAPAGIVSSGRRVSIGRPATSGTREGPAVSRRLGSVVRSAFFFFKSLQNVEVPYVQELYRSSSR